MTSDDFAQVKKFRDAARELECDEDEARWEERLKTATKGKPRRETPE